MQHRALRELAKYTLLTIALAVRVGVGRDRSAVGAALAQLQRVNFVDSTPGKFIPGLGELSSVFWLTAKGANLLHELDGIEVATSRRRMSWLNEGAHRLDVVRTHITLREWVASVGGTVPQVVVDFEAGWPGRQKATMFEWIDKATRRKKRFPPDAWAQVNLSGGRKHLLVIEVERGGATADLAAFREKLPRLRALAESERVEDEFQLPDAARFIVVFRTEAMRRRALSKWPDPDAAVWGHFFVKSYYEMHDFNGAWAQPGRQSRPLFLNPA